MDEERRQEVNSARLVVVEDALRFILWRLGVPDDLLGAWVKARDTYDPVYVHLAMNNIMATMREPLPDE